MFARITYFVLSEMEEAAAADVVEQILPTVRDLDGYRGMVVLSDVEGGRIVSLSLWETAETAKREVESQDLRCSASWLSTSAISLG